MRLINDVLEFTDHEKIKAILFSADFEKAFDSIEHSFLFSALKCFGFSDEFIQWLRTLLRPRLHGYIFKSFRFHFVAFSNQSTLDCIFKYVAFS